MSVSQEASGQIQSRGHPSRRDNQSVSSMASSSGSRSGQAEAPANPAVESAVTRLLVAIKQLLEALTLWSTGQMSEGQVSDVYVRLGNDFNAAVAAFDSFNIEMTELMSVPDDLRLVLEQCLAEDATPENLEVYLPTVRQIITGLLQGLRGKQHIYRRVVSDHRHGSSASTSDSNGQRQSSRTSRSERPPRREGEPSRSQRSQLSRVVGEDERSGDSDNTSRRSAQSSGRRRDITPQSPQSPTEEESSASIENGAPDRSVTPSQSSSRRQPPTSPPLPPIPRSVSTPDEPIQRSASRAGNIPPPIDVEKETPPTPPPSQVPANVKRYSLVDRPSSPPAVVVEEAHDYLSPRLGSSELPETPPLDSLTAPAMANSLAALKKSDTLERRASKRFSTYNISKMTGGGGGTATRERSVRGNHPNRRSMAATTTLTPGELNTLTEEDEEAGSPVATRDNSFAHTSGSPTPPPTTNGDHLPELVRQSSPTPRISPVANHTPASDKISEAASALEGDRGASGSSLRSFPVFLQLGREVKKVTIEPGLSFSSLRVLFVDRFSYNPGLENFPAIYIRDPSSGVQYELEDMEEVKSKCLLSLNIEPLDQIKQHIDAQISGLSNDIKDLKTTVAASRAQAPQMQPFMAQEYMDNTVTHNRPSDSQLRHVARRLSRIVGDGSSPMQMQPMQPQMTGQTLVPQMTGGSVLSDYSSRIVTDLKTQFDEVQNLRRDLGIMRQLYTDFVKQTKESLGTLRTQTQGVKQLATTNVGGARGYIDSGKTNLDMRSQNILTKVEALQDTVESVKEDVLKRHITPIPQFFKTLKKDIDSAAAELESLKEHIKTIKPMWKKTWEEELQNIVEEQQFLSHQEEFLGDLLEDHKAVIEVYGHVDKVISIRGSGSSKKIRKAGGFRPPPPEEGHTGLSTVMLEIRGAAIDPERRMKAIAESQKIREKELATRGDEFQAELSGFVGGKKLKMTGGAEEVERVRQKRSDMTLKAMFTGGSTASSSAAFDPSEMSPSSPGQSL